MNSLPNTQSNNEKYSEPSQANILDRAFLDRLQAAYKTCAGDLLAERNSQGHWTGELSTSCLSTATAVSALSLYLKNLPADSPWSRDSLEEFIFRGTQYLLDHSNSDSGWGDTDKSFSNVATTFLGWAALTLAKETFKGSPASTKLSQKQADLLERIQTAIPAVQKRIEEFGGVKALKDRYGKDKTFVVPILTNCALAGLADWKDFSALPFEMSVFPQKMYRFFNMAVVSYAIPALVAIGQAHFFHRKPFWPIRWIRKAAIAPSMNVLLGMQPASGGYLEAAPLTSFVAMSLAATGRAGHKVTTGCVRFLVEGVLPDGSWPIDTNLATWVTTQSTIALSSIGSSVWSDGYSHETESSPKLPSVADVSPECWEWIKNCQYTKPHPATGAEPGGWGWTDLSGSVPDADDTPGALLALFSARQLTQQGLLRLDLKELDDQAERGIQWLVDLQNRDGGWPTFCKGWGQLPFDKSGSDLTAHALRAINTWWPVLSEEKKQKLFPFAKTARSARGLEEGLSYIVRNQRADGSWLPLWFGNQDLPDDENPVYGTSKSLMCLIQFYGSVASETGFAETNQRFLKRQLTAPVQAIKKGVTWLIENQNSDGGWGGGESLRRFVQEQGLKKLEKSGLSKISPDWSSSVEETALAVDALAMAKEYLSGNDEYWESTNSGDTRTEVWDRQRLDLAFFQGASWLCDRIDQGWHRLSWPIGFYFAKLWYHERLYPLIFTTSALGRSLKVLNQSGASQST